MPLAFSHRPIEQNNVSRSELELYHNWYGLECIGVSNITTGPPSPWNASLPDDESFHVEGVI